jgi:hypothetical protein
MDRRKHEDELKIVQKQEEHFKRVKVRVHLWIFKIYLQLYVVLRYSWEGILEG